MTKELVGFSKDGKVRSGFNEKDLPLMIQEQIRELNDLEKSVKRAIEAAEDAKNSAEIAKNKSAGFGKRKAAIEELQSAGIDLAEALQSGAEAQKISFEFQTKLARITKYLFGLGVSNIASNRFVVRELEMRLKGASQEQLSELARQELITVIRQLKEQEDILRKQEVLSETIKIHDDRFKVQFRNNNRIDEQLQVHTEIHELHEDQLKIHAEINERLQEQISDLQEKNSDLIVQIESNLKAIKEQEIKLNNLEDELNNLKILLDSKANNTLLKTTLVMAGIGLVASLIQLF